jgi:hypothetical protein
LIKIKNKNSKNKPVNNSTRIQPKLHISIAVVYEIPKITSGAR